MKEHAWSILSRATHWWFVRTMRIERVAARAYDWAQTNKARAWMRSQGL